MLLNEVHLKSNSVLLKDGLYCVVLGADNHHLRARKPDALGKKRNQVHSSMHAYTKRENLTTAERSMEDQRISKNMEQSKQENC